MKLQSFLSFCIVASLSLCSPMASSIVILNAEFSPNSAEQVPESSQEDMPIIVIIGKRPRPIEDVFGSASVISRNNLDKQLSQDLFDSVRYLTGINVEYAGSRFGQSGLSIRGIGGNRVAMEIDGVPMADQFTIGSYSYAGRNLIELDDIQQVEILKGPASSIYGSDAIGGVVNFISRKPNDLLSETQRDYFVGLKSAYKSADNSKSLTLQGAVPIGDFSVLASLTERRGNELSHKAASNLENDEQSTDYSSAMVYGIYDINPNHQLGLRYQNVERNTDSDVRSILGLGRFAATSALLGDDKSVNRTLSLHYDFVFDNSIIDGGVVRLYQQSTETQQFTLEDRTSRGRELRYDRRFFYQQDIQGARVNLYSKLYGKQLEHEIGYGIEVSQSKVEELRDAVQTSLASGATTNIILSEDFPVRDFPNSDINEYGFYINDQISITDSGFSIIPAIRYDNYRLTPNPDNVYLADNPATIAVSVKEDHWTPKIGLAYEFSASNQVYVQYSEGFRAPPFEDANIGLDIPLFNIRAIPNPELKAETSKGIELGFTFTNPTHSIDWVIFHNDYDDFIQTKVNLGFDPISGRVLFQSQNLDRASIYGTEINYTYNINESLSVNASGYWSKGENEVSQQPLNDVEPHQLVTSVVWQHQQFSGSFNITHTAEKGDIDKLEQEPLFTSPRYTTVDVFANYRVNDQLTLSASINNLRDQTYWYWSAVNGLQANDPLVDVLSAPGREFAVQLRFNW